MAEFIANTVQTVAVNDNVIFTDTIVKPCLALTHRDGSGIFTLHGGHSFLVMYSANVAGTTADEATLALTLNGEELNGTRMASTSGSAGSYNNVATAVYITVPRCCCYTLAVKNIGTTTVNVATSNIIFIKEE